MSFKDHFSTKASLYAKYRPAYPSALFTSLASLAPCLDLAWDCGCGNGQAAVALAEHFARVVATEPSEAQLEAAKQHPRVEYHRSAERAVVIQDGSVDLVTAASAVHWFDRNHFYAEVRRVLRPGGLLAVWSYGLCRIDRSVDRLVDRFYHEVVGPFWPPERRAAESNYRHLEFPFPELPFPTQNLEMEWSLDDFVGYLNTWSAVTRYTQARGHNPTVEFQHDLSCVWGTGRRRVVWPLGGRLGRVGN